MERIEELAEDRDEAEVEVYPFRLLLTVYFSFTCSVDFLLSGGMTSKGSRGGEMPRGY